MARIVFFEKPGCINGEKQKKILQDAGHVLECKNILTHRWSRDALLPFVSKNTPPTMMNYTAPAIKNGEIDPESLTFEEALQLMIEYPILIKRPLIAVDGQMIQGFDHPDLQTYLGDWDHKQDVITCPNLAGISCDNK